MNFSVALIVLSTLTVPFRTAGQTTEPDQRPAHSSPTNAPTQAPPPPVATQTPPVAERPVSWKLLLHNLIADQERIWSFPARLVQGQSLIPTTAVLGATAGLLALDPIEAGYFHRTSTFQGFNNVFTSNVTIAGTIAAPVSLYAIGLIRKDGKMQRTALFAAEAVDGDGPLSATADSASALVGASSSSASGADKILSERISTSRPLLAYGKTVHC